MAYPKGKARPEGAGRKKGTPNKDTLPLEELASKYGCNPFQILIQFAAGDWEGLGYAAKSSIKYSNAGIEMEEDVITPIMRLTAAKEAAQYLYSKKKAVEISTDESKGFKIEVVDYTAEKK